MRERNETVVVYRGRWMPAIQFGIHIVDVAKQQDRLVDQVAAEIVEEPARLGRVGTLAPSRSRLRAPAFEP